MTENAMKKITSVAVYCGSATPENPAFMDCAREAGHYMAQHGLTTVYGGGKLGLMGAVANSALDNGGKVIGIIPEALVSKEVAHQGCTELKVVPGMHERKKAFTDLSDAFLVLPGGVGTMDELWEALSWSQIGYHHSPVGLLNVDGYYDGLIAFYQHMANTGFVRPAHSGIMLYDDNLERLMDKMAHYQPHQTITAMKAKDL